jgi:hypothetical protein
MYPFLCRWHRPKNQYPFGQVADARWFGTTPIWECILSKHSAGAYDGNYLTGVGVVIDSAQTPVAERATSSQMSDHPRRGDPQRGPCGP